ncbi:MAG TPA: hypothetical protein VHV26_12180 [Rhizomicrobium sp.]|jgi:hypothetical protein|nr:hypothetical protein [Rhizomicrobium sp.]
MNLILGFTPFLAFFLVSRLSVDLALWAAFAAAFVVTIRDFVESPSVRLLDLGNLLVFGSLALVRGFLLPGLSAAQVHLAAELALLLLLAGSILTCRPFSLQYARPAPGEIWPPGLFRRVNYMTSTIWLIAFAAMAGADAIVSFMPVLPVYPAVAVGVGALAVAITFTLYYPAFVARGFPVAPDFAPPDRTG